VVPDVMPRKRSAAVFRSAPVSRQQGGLGMTRVHSSTFGGNPLAVAATNAVLDVMLKPFFEHVRRCRCC
jgi:acetylornithine/N-succinyldiaminopimelate aminotransferase